MKWVELMKRVRIMYLLGGCFGVILLAFNIYTSILVFELKNKIEEFYQKDFVDVRVVSEQLVLDIEKAYGKKLPPIELNIRLSEYSSTGIQYDNKTLRLFLPPKIVNFDSNEKRAYLAHEFGHYILGHTDLQNINTYNFFGVGDLNRDIEADSFALNFSIPKDLFSVIKKFVWDDNERKTRLAAVGGN